MVVEWNLTTILQFLLGTFATPTENEKFLLFCCGFVVTLADFAVAMGQNEDTPIAGFAADW